MEGFANASTGSLAWALYVPFSLERSDSGSEQDPNKPELGEIQGYQELKVFSILEIGCTALACAQQKENPNPYSNQGCLQGSWLKASALLQKKTFIPTLQDALPPPPVCKRHRGRATSIGTLPVLTKCPSPQNRREAPETNLPTPPPPPPNRASLGLIARESS